ncbi:MAG: glycosyltransferase family 4 protein [Cephaloticoccus sp.]|nr:glycosyltransferase family 4 protein [Cephaloticoccus sp.]
MNTLLLAPELFTTDSGIPRMLRLYLKALCEIAGSKSEVRFVSLNDAAIDPSHLNLYSGPALTKWSTCKRGKLKFICETLRQSRGTRLIICGHVAQLPVAWLASWFRPGLRTILIAHGIEVWRPFTFLERLALRNAHRILCVSDFTRREILKHIKIDASRMVVLPNALDPALEHKPDPAVQDNSSPVILTVSRLSSSDRYKGIDHLIAAMPAVLRAKPDTKLHIVGRGDDLPRLQNLVRENKIDHAVKFVGFVSDEQLRTEFAQCTCFALPSQKEGFGLVYLEAMTAGKPCLAANAGGAPEVIPSEAGMIVPYGDVPGIAIACIQILAKKWDPKTIQTCAQEFSYSRFKDRLTALLPT